MPFSPYSVDTSKVFMKENVDLKPPFPFEDLKDLNKLKIKKHLLVLIKREFRKTWRTRKQFLNLKKMELFSLGTLISPKIKETNNNINIILKLIQNMMNFFKKIWFIILNNFRKKWIIEFIYNSKLIWYFIAYINVLKSKEIHDFLKKKLIFRIYAHRVNLHITIRSIPINKRVVISFIPFLLSAINIIILKFRPHHFRYNLPLLSPPIQTVKWETLLMSDIALKILAQETNKIVYCGDHLLIHRNKFPKLFGNRSYKGYILVKESDKKRKFKSLREIMSDLDYFPNKLASYKQTAPLLIDLKRLNKLIASHLSDDAIKYILKQISLYTNLAKQDFLLRYSYSRSTSHYKFWAYIREKLLINAKSNKKEFTTTKKENTYGNKRKKPKIDKSKWDDKDFLVEDNVNIPPRVARPVEKKIVFPILPNEDKIIKDTTKWLNLRQNSFLFLNKINPILIHKHVEKRILDLKYEVIKELLTLYRLQNLKKGDIKKALYLRLFNEDASKISYNRFSIPEKTKVSLKDKKIITDALFDDECFFDLSSKNKLKKKKSKKIKKFYKLEKIENKKFQKLYKNSPEVVENSILWFKKRYEFPIEDARIFIRPRAMTGYTYPDSSLSEVRSLLLYEFFTQFKKKTVIKIDLPPDFSITSYFPMSYPEVPDIESEKIKIAAAKRKNSKRSFNDVVFSNILGSHLDPPDYMSVEEKEELGLFGIELDDGEKLPFNYKGPGVVITKNNDVVLSSKYKPSKDVKHYLYRCRIPFDYYTGSSADKENKDLPQLRKNYDIIREWLLNYLTPDNPIEHGTLVTSDIDNFINIKRDELDRRTINNPEYQQLLAEQLGHCIFRAKRKGFWKKWGIFPYRRGYLDSPSYWNSSLPSKSYGILIGYSDNDWTERTEIKKEFVFTVWREEAAGDYEEVDNSNYEKKRILATLKGYLSGVLPTSPFFLPQKRERTKLFFGPTPELDYNANPHALQFIYKVYRSIYNPKVTELIRGLGFGHQSLVTTSLNSQKKGLFSDALEPVTGEFWKFWLYISYIAFIYLSFMLVKQVVAVYSHELIRMLLDQLQATGYLPPEVREELNVLLGYKDAGFRIATEFSKGFCDIVGIELYLNQLVEMVLYLRGGISNPDIAKNAQTLLLVGPPGTGKTIIVHALALEAKVPVLTLTAQGLQEPDAIDRLFRKAQELSPCIVFFDEVDNIGHARAGVLGFDDVLNDDFLKKSITEEETPEISTIIGNVDELNPRLLQNKKDFHMVVNRDTQNYFIKKNHDEYYRIGILSRLLTELDGISSRDGVVIIGATNRVNVLDPALLRPGRFNRHLKISLPSKEKRLQLFQFYTKGLGGAPDVPWEYLSKLTFGFSAADIATIMNESCMKAVLDKSIHTLESIEHGIDRLTTTTILKPTSNEQLKAAGNDELEYYYSTVRGAYYQAGKALVGTLLKNHPPIMALHLWYRENSVRYDQIQLTTLVEWLRFAFRGELEHRIIGAFGGKAGEWVFLESLGDMLNDESISNMGAQEWRIAQALILLLVDKWHIYASHHSLLQEQRPLLSNFNLFVYNEVKEQYLYEFAQTFEASPKGFNLLGFEEDKNPQTLFSLTWWQMRLCEHYLELELQKWYSLWIPDPEEWKFNPRWVSPDSTFNQNSRQKDIFFGTKYKDLALLVRDYRIHSIILESCNISFLIATTYRELLDQLAHELLREGILREYQIYDIFADFGIDCKKLKEELKDSLNSAIFDNDLPDVKILYRSWGAFSVKPTIRWIDIEAIRNTNFSKESIDIEDDIEDDIDNENENDNKNDIENENENDNKNDTENDNKNDIENDIKDEIKEDIEDIIEEDKDLESIDNFSNESEGEEIRKNESTFDDVNQENIVDKEETTEPKSLLPGDILDIYYYGVVIKQNLTDLNDKEESNSENSDENSEKENT